MNTSEEGSLVGVFDFQPYLDASGDTNASPDNALQLANAYNVSGNNEPTPDEIGTYDDPTLGGFLAYFVSDGGPGDFGLASSSAPYILSNTTPDNTMDWSNWTITTAAAPAGAETASGSPVLADMYLWNSQTGALYLWELTGLANEVPGGIDVTSTGQVQSWTVDIDDSTATATIAQANAANSSQLLQTGG